MPNTLQIPHGAFHMITALEHCAWPNLTLLPNGEIGAAIHNKPSHATVEADVEFWVTPDNGNTWQLRSRITNHAPMTTRMNVAAGLNTEGHIIVLCAGWSLDQRDGHNVRTAALEALAHVSRDNGATWEQTSELSPPPDAQGFTAFGDIGISGDELVVAGYTREFDRGQRVATSSHMYHSLDDGRSWQYVTTIDGGDHNETDLLVRTDGPWLASVRMGDVHRPGCENRANITLYTSVDHGRSWTPGSVVTRPDQHTSHLMRLADGRILLSYGSRMEELYGVVARIGDPRGETWSPPFVLIGGLDNRDCGYPSSVQVDTGDIVTAYYAKSAPWCQRYHMGVLRWNLDMVGNAIPQGNTR